MVLPIYRGGFFCSSNNDRKVYIGDKYLRKHMPKNIKPMSNIDKITYGCETCISDMLLK